MTLRAVETEARRSQRGAAMPSPVVLLSIIAVVLAAVAFVATRDTEPTEREITATKAAATPTDSSSPSGGASGDPSGSASDTTQPEQSEKPKPKPIVRKDYDVLVFNNTLIKGLAAKVAEQVERAGWKSAVPDNWKGTVLATTVYYPEGKRRAAQQLALDLGVARVLPADVDSDMSTEKLTLILTGEL